MLDEEEAVGRWAGTGLQPSHAPPHTLASRISHRLPPERLASAARRDGGVGYLSKDLCSNASDEQCCHLVVVAAVPKIQICAD